MLTGQRPVFLWAQSGLIQSQQAEGLFYQAQNAQIHALPTGLRTAEKRLVDRKIDRWKRDYIFFMWLYIGLLLDDMLKEKWKFLKPWKGVFSIVSVYLSANGPQGIYTFCGWVILGTRERNIFFLFFEIYYTYITLVIFLFQTTGHSFWPRNVIFGLSEPCTIVNWRLF